MRNDPLKERIVFAKVFLAACTPEGKPILDAYKKAFEEDLRSNGKLSVFTKRWGTDWKREFDGFITELFADLAIANEAWLKNPAIETFPLPKEHLERLIKRRLYAVDPRLQHKLFASPSKSVSDRARARVDKNYKLFAEMVKRIYSSAKKRNPEAARKIEDEARRFVEENIPKQIAEEAKAVSVYAFAKEKGLERRQLLYLLRKIGFPLQNALNRSAHLVSGRSLDNLERMAPAIQDFLKQDKNYREWIGVLSQRWRKSRNTIRRFMRRRISEGLVPEWFFDYIEPDSDSNELIENLKKRTDFKTTFLQSPITAKLISREQTLASLRESVRQMTRTILTD